MIIGITGLAGAGKDTTAAYIMKKYPKYKKLSFASKLKDMTAELYGWDRKKLEGITNLDRKWREVEDLNLSKIFGRKITPRHELQLLGTGLRNILQRNFWTCMVKNEIIKKNLKNVVITDVRFPDEIEMIRSLGGIIFEVRRFMPEPEWYGIAWKKNLGYSLFYDKIFNRRIYKLYLKQHPSETSWIGVNKPDFIVENMFSLFSLEKETYRIMKEVNQLERERKNAVKAKH